jgi:hypothetical protein
MAQGIRGWAHEMAYPVTHTSMPCTETRACAAHKPHLLGFQVFFLVFLSCSGVFSRCCFLGFLVCESIVELLVLLVLVFFVRIQLPCVWACASAYKNTCSKCEQLDAYLHVDKCVRMRMLAQETACIRYRVGPPTPSMDRCMMQAFSKQNPFYPQQYHPNRSSATQTRPRTSRLLHVS